MALRNFDAISRTLKRKLAMAKAHRNLVLYDGVCGFCDRTVQFLLKIDTANVLSFAALQGETAANIASNHHLKLNAEMPETILFVENFQTADENVFEKSTAAIKILFAIGGKWKVLGGLMSIVPNALRDRIYVWFATHHYQWFGKFDSCQLPSPEVRAKFLE